MNPTVSVVIPAYNAARFLGEALASVREQTFAPLETIVVDDASSDETASIALESGSILHTFKERRGVSAARNYAIRRARGDWIALLDADDVWQSDKLALQIDAVLAAPGTELCTAHFRYFLHPGATPPPHLDTAILGVPQPKTCPSAWLIRRTLFDRVGLFPEELRVAEDIAWLARANTMNVNTLAMPDCLVDKRIHDTNISGEFAETYRQTFASLRASLTARRGGEVSAS